MTARSKCRSQYRHRFTLQLFPGSGVQICTTHFRRSLIWSTLLCNDLHPEILDRHYPDSSTDIIHLCVTLGQSLDFLFLSFSMSQGNV